MCGSRAHLEDESIAQRTFIRTILMWVLKLLRERDEEVAYTILAHPCLPVLKKKKKLFWLRIDVLCCYLGLVSTPAFGFLLWRLLRTPSAVSRCPNHCISSLFMSYFTTLTGLRYFNSLSSAAEKKNRRGPFQHSSHREMGFWCGDVEGGCHDSWMIVL